MARHSRPLALTPLATGCLLALVATLAACGDKNMPAPKAPAPEVAAKPAPAPAPVARREGVNLSQEIRDACGIATVTEAPKFDYDSSAMSSTDRDQLNQLARCLTTGPLKGRPVQLVGRADPRGETEYNMTLGESRATTVRKYLNSLGVEASRMTETSRGELDATGHDEESWKQDRRVDIALK
jgi:peptidoglycan-associated lipoprotein